jgi:5-methylcytosine-specific restriction endonuclease McrA
MSEYEFWRLFGQVCGIIVADYLLSIIVAAVTHKRYFTKGYYKQEDFITYRKHKVHLLFWSFLSIYAIVMVSIGGFLLVFIVVWAIKGVFILVRKVFMNGQESFLDIKERRNGLMKKATKAEIDTSDVETHRTMQDDSKIHSSNLTESEEYWGLISFAYGKIKQTNIFKLWRKEQFDCQFGKCAICGKPMEIRYAQVDHIKPRYKKGTNYSNNLALAHKKCNELKGAKTGYERPNWIKDNKYSEKLDEKVYEITEEIRIDYPTKFPDELFKKPGAS